ncbi:MAG: hypothetical protein ACRD1Z_15755, partial [Vicinamibacteria bacterium]
MRVRLFFKVIVMTSLLILATSIPLSLFFIRYESERTRAELEAKGRSLIDNLANSSEFGLVFEERDFLDSITRSVLRQQDVVYAVVSNPDESFIVEAYAPDYGGPRSAEIRLSGRSADELAIRLGAQPGATEPIYSLSAPIFSTRPAGEDTEVSFFREGATRQRVGTAFLGISSKTLDRNLHSARTALVLI